MLVTWRVLPSVSVTPARALVIIVSEFHHLSDNVISGIVFDSTGATSVIVLDTFTIRVFPTASDSITGIVTLPNAVKYRDVEISRVTVFHDLLAVTLIPVGTDPSLGPGPGHGWLVLARAAARWQRRRAARPAKWGSDEIGRQHQPRPRRAWQRFSGSCPWRTGLPNTGCQSRAFINAGLL